MQLDSLSDFNRNIISGLHKKWIYKDINSHFLAIAFLQKIDFSINDIKLLIKSKEKNHDISASSVLQIVVLADWITNSVYEIKKLIKENIIRNFNFSCKLEIERVSRYIKAIRSFLIAHPLTTKKHKEYGLDGSYVCIDLNIPIDFFAFAKERVYHLSLEGLTKSKNLKADIKLRCYKTDEKKFISIITLDSNDILYSIALYLKQLKELGKYLFLQKRNNYKV